MDVALVHTVHCEVCAEHQAFIIYRIPYVIYITLRTSGPANLFMWLRKSCGVLYMNAFVTLKFIYLPTYLTPKSDHLKPSTFLKEVPEKY